MRRKVEVGPTELGGDFVPNRTTPPYFWAAIAAGGVFFLYTLTLSPTTAFWDTSEYIATAHILGVPHAPGNPLFLILARTWEILLAPLGLSVAVRINLFSACMSAAAHGLWFLVVHHILGFFNKDPRFRLVGAFVAVVISATAFTVWNQSNVNEKVYTVSLLTIAFLTWLAIRWQARVGTGRETKLLVLMAFILALSVGNHLMAFLAAPAIAVFILVVRPRTMLDLRLYPAILAAVVLGLSVHLYLPLRAALDPVINQNDPTCTGIGSALTAIVTFGKHGCVALGESLTRTQYGVMDPATGEILSQTQTMFALPWDIARPRTPGLFLSQLLHYFQYFDWQWSRGVQGTQVLLANLRLPFTMLFAGLGVWGAIEHSRRDRASFLYILVLFGTLSLGLVGYMNFKYGYSIPPEVGNFDIHEVRERDYFFLGSFSVWGLWAGVGLTAIWGWLAKMRIGTLLKASPILALALIPLALNWGWATRADDYTARDFAYNLLMSVEPYGVLFTAGDNDTFPTWYLQEVEGVRRDVTVIVTTYLNTPWYTKQTRDLARPCPPGVSAGDDPTRIICQRPYEPDARAEYTTDLASARAAGRVPIPLEAPVESPRRGILDDLDDGTIDEVSERFARVESTVALRMGNVDATLEGGQYLSPAQQFGLSIMSSALGDRPIYFAARDTAESFGVGDQVVRQGLVFNLPNGLSPSALPEGVVAIPPSVPLYPLTGPYVDVPRTERLLEEVFRYRGGLPESGRWPDRTVGVNHVYARAYWALAQAALQADDARAVNRFVDQAEWWGALGS